jgi:hypothetical protein
MKKEDPRDVIGSLNSLPATLPEAYMGIVERMRNDDSLRCQVAFKALSWIFHTKRPLYMPELLNALSIRINDTEFWPKYMYSPEYVLGMCHGFVAYDNSSNVVSFTHYSVYKFLGRDCITLLLNLTDLAAVCLTCLTFNMFEDGPCADSESLGRRLESYRFIQYSVEFWAVYTEGAGEEETTVRDILFRLFRSTHKRNAIWQLDQMFCNRRWENWQLGSFEDGEWTPLHIISQKGFASLYDEIANGTDQKLTMVEQVPLGDLNARDPGGMTALHLAALHKKDKMVVALLKAGADPDARNKNGYTALHCAADGGHTEVVTAILEAGVDIEVRRVDPVDMCGISGPRKCGARAFRLGG